jgi:hypothetical protein
LVSYAFCLAPHCCGNSPIGLILTDMKTDLKSAQPELDQLTKNLVQLEDNLFPNP